MLNTLFQKGHRLFAAASAIAIIISVLHTTALLNVPADDSWSLAFDAMKIATAAPDIPAPSLFDVTLGAWLQVGALLFMLGAKNLALLATLPSETVPRMMRAVSYVDGIAYAALAILFYFLSIPPPMISFAILGVMFLACGWRTRPGATNSES